MRTLDVYNKSYFCGINFDWTLYNVLIKSNRDINKNGFLYYFYQYEWHGEAIQGCRIQNLRVTHLSYLYAGYKPKEYYEEVLGIWSR